MADNLYNHLEQDIALDIKPRLHHQGDFITIKDEINILNGFNNSLLVRFRIKKLIFEGFNHYQVGSLDNKTDLDAGEVNFLNFLQSDLDILSKSRLARCEHHLKKGCALIYGSIYAVYDDGSKKSVIEYAVYPVKANSDTGELLPVDMVKQYIENEFNNTLNILDNKRISLPRQLINTRLSRVLDVPKNMITGTLALMALTATSAGTTYAIMSKNDVQNNPKENSGQIFQNQALEPILLASHNGAKSTMSDMANLQVATTEEYLKKMGIDVNNQDGLSCLKD